MRPALVLGLAFLGVSVQALGASPPILESPFDTDGWHTWRVAAIDGAPDWCCFEWHSGQATRNACDLSDEHAGYGGGKMPSSAVMQVYALQERGALTKLRTFSTRCEVTGAGDSVDMGTIAANESVEWLRPFVGTRSNLTGDALASLAAHAGESARRLLENTARRGSPLKTRKEAIFWMGLVRFSESGDALRDLMRTEQHKELRHHAVFSYAQSAADDREAVLISLLESRDLSLDDRKNALFWLVQTQSPDAIDYIQRLLTSE